MPCGMIPFTPIWSMLLSCNWILDGLAIRLCLMLLRLLLDGLHLSFERVQLCDYARKIV